MKKYQLKEVKKTVVGVVGFVVTLLTTILAVGPDLIPDKYLPYIHIVIALASSYGIFAVKNVTAQPSGRADDNESVADDPNAGFDGEPWGETTERPTW